MKVIAGSASKLLAGRLAKALGWQLIKPEIRRFPDSETYVRIPRDIKGEHVIVVQSTCAPTNDNLIELFLLLDTVKDLGAKRVTAVVPYFGYARQDKRFKSGEAISVRTVCKLIERAGADELFTVDIHEDEIMKTFAIPAHNLSAMSLIGRYLAKLHMRAPAIMGADQGSLARARKVAAELAAEYDYLEKTRLTPTKVLTKPKCLDVAGRDVVIIDDIISTGGTMVEAARVLKKQKARKIYAVCTHPVLVNNALKKISAAGVRKVIATDTIEHKTSTISVAPLIAGAIR